MSHLAMASLAAYIVNLTDPMIELYTFILHLFAFNNSRKPLPRDSVIYINGCLVQQSATQSNQFTKMKLENNLRAVFLFFCVAGHALGEC